MKQSDVTTVALAVLIAIALISYPQILGNQTTGALTGIGLFILGVLRPQPTVPAPPNNKPD